MPRFHYIAKSRPNEVTQGDIEAKSEQEAVAKLTRMGYFPISVTTELFFLEKKSFFGFRKIPSKEIVLFTRQLASLLESGVNVIKAIHIISNQAQNKYLKIVLDDVAHRIKDGKTLSESFSVYPHLFSDLYRAMIHTGEVGGTLAVTLKNLSDFIEKEDEFKNSVQASLIYPLFILIVGIVTVLVLILFVIPRLVSMFEDMGQLLPLPTRILIAVSDYLQKNGWLVSLVIFVLVLFVRRVVRSPLGRLSLDRFRIEAFLLGQIILKAEVSRFMRTLSLLLSSGIPITQALEISASVLENTVLKSEAENFKEEIRGGLSLSSALKKSKFFPEFVTSIVMIGEESGSLDKSLLRVAVDFEKELSRALKTLIQIMEPAVILAMGLVVGFIVLSMLLPIFQINLIVR
ncbi:MAG: type II secretion system F family protein [Candidatus Omnitrophica bacterium]|nr:type II secretion system F family protein [Candidatus Omnitrophota bacterium]